MSDLLTLVNDIRRQVKSYHKSGHFSRWIWEIDNTDAVELLAAHDARLLDEAAERARKKCYEYIAYGMNNGCAMVNVEEVCAAVRGKE